MVGTGYGEVVRTTDELTKTDVVDRRLLHGDR